MKAIPTYQKIRAFAQAQRLPFFTIHQQFAARLLWEKQQEKKHHFLNLLKLSA